MAGQHVGSLVVVGRVLGGSRKGQWLCRCSCGATRIITGAHLRAIQASGKEFTCCTNGVHRSDVVDRLLVLEYRRSATYKEVGWGLDDAEAIRLFHHPYFYCGRRGVNRRKYRGSEFPYNGIDRIDSNYGYEAGNVVACCKPCNYAKNKLSQTEFLRLVWLIAKRHPKEAHSGGTTPEREDDIRCLA